MGKGTSKSFGYVDPDANHISRGRPGMRKLERELDGAFKALETPGTGGTGCFATDEFDIVAAMSAAFVLASTAAIASAQTITTFVNSVIPTPRNLSIVCTVVGTGAGNIVVSGLDISGNVLTETFAVPAATSTLTGKNAFATITSITVPPLTTGMTALHITVGTGKALGLGSPIKIRQGTMMVYMEMEDGASVAGGASTGAWATPANGLPYGTYTPYDDPNATHGWVVSYERDNS